MLIQCRILFLIVMVFCFFVFYDIDWELEEVFENFNKFFDDFFNVDRLLGRVQIYSIFRKVYI